MKNILILSDKLNSGGVEVALINFIKKISEDNKDINITLMLKKAEGVYLDELKNICKIVEIPMNNCIYKQILDIKLKNIKDIKLLKSKFKLIYIKLLHKVNCTTYYTKILSECIKTQETYDLAIDFHGYGYIGTCYIAERVNADKKILFIHDENIKWVKDIKNWLKFYDKFYCVSESCIEILEKRYSEVVNKTEIFHNIIYEKEIIEKSVQKIDENISHEFINILTIGRLEHQKGYDLLVDICKELKKQYVRFRWYIIGTGREKLKIQKWINENNLRNEIILLGMKKNPYPYLRLCDIYVQPSRHEGYGIAIAEARCLNKPIVATNIKCIEEQIVNNKTGILCEFNKDEFFKAIKKLIEDINYRRLFSENLKKIKIKTTNDINKIYNLLD